MAITPEARRGFTLLIALIFMSVMLAFGLALSALAYKQQVLASSAIEAQYAFYAADAALECALYADQQQNLFAYVSNFSAPAPAMTCAGAAPVSATVLSHTGSQWVIGTRLSFDLGKRCADVTTYKPAASGTTYLFSQGYDVPCTTVASPSGARLTVRGIQTHYNSFAQLPGPPPSPSGGCTLSKALPYVAAAEALASALSVRPPGVNFLGCDERDPSLGQLPDIPPGDLTGYDGVIFFDVSGIIVANTVALPSRPGFFVYFAGGGGSRFNLGLTGSNTNAGVGGILSNNIVTMTGVPSGTAYSFDSCNNTTINGISLSGSGPCSGTVP